MNLARVILEEFFQIDRCVSIWLTMAGKNQFAADMKQEDNFVAYMELVK